MIDSLFVYGTLMLKYPLNPHRALLEKHCLESFEATTLGILYSLGDYPGMVLGSDIVYGEVLKIEDSETLFGVLDEYEGYYKEKKESSYYIRQRHLCVINTEETLNSWTYIYNKTTTHQKRLNSGKFY